MAGTRDGSVAPATPPLHPAKPRGEVGYDPLSNPRAREMTISARKRVNRIRRTKNRRRCGATRTFAICTAVALRARNVNNLKKRIEEVKAEKTKLAEKIKVMEQRIKTLEETNRIPVPESAESVSEKMTKFKARLAKYKEFELVPYERRTE